MSSWEDDDKEDEEDDNNIDDEFKSIDDHMIFLIDARSPMFQMNSKNQTFIVDSLNVALAVMKSKIIATDKDTIGIFFFGTRAKNSETESTIENVYSLFSMDVPSADRIKKIQNYIDDVELLKKDIGSQPESITACPLKTSLWSCAHEFNTKSSGVAKQLQCYRRIWIFTNDDNPNANDCAEQSRIIQVAKDAAETGIDISLWCYNPRGLGRSFDISLFYSRLLRAGEEEVGGEDSSDLSSRIVCAGREDSFETQLVMVRRKIHRKRQLGSLLMSLSSDLRIAVKLYKLILPSKRPTYTWLDAKTNQPAKLQSRYLNSSTGEQVDAFQLVTSIEINGAKIPITKSDLLTLSRTNILQDTQQVKEGEEDSVGESFLKVLYFLPSSALKNDMNYTSPNFLFPDELKIKGSALFFSVLIQDMLAKDLIGIALFARNKSSGISLVALLPQSENTIDNVTVQSGGINMIPLPYNGELRSVSAVLGVGEGLKSPTPEEIEIATKLVQALQLDESFVYSELENPSLQRFYSGLQAIALTESQADWDPEINDMLQPDPIGMSVHKEEIMMLRAVTGCDGIESTEGTTSKSRKRVADSTSTDITKDSKKKRNNADENHLLGDTTDIRTTIKTEIVNGTLTKRTVAELKEFCKSLSLPVSGTKAVLVDRITAAQ